MTVFWMHLYSGVWLSYCLSCKNQQNPGASCVFVCNGPLYEQAILLVGGKKGWVVLVWTFGETCLFVRCVRVMACSHGSELAAVSRSVCLYL